MAEYRIEVDFTGPFRDICGCRNIGLDVDKELGLPTLIGEIASKFGLEFTKRLGMSEEGYDGELATVIVNGTVVRGPKLREVVLKPGDHVVFAPSLAGGG